MTNLYFVRHAKVIYTEDDHSRPLSEEGQADIIKVTNFFKNIQVDRIVSSPFIRAVHTIQGIAEDKGLSIDCYDGLRERKVAHGFIEDFETFTTKQWHDFEFKLEGGESLAEVRKRGIKAIHHLLDIHRDKNIVIGTHGTFLAVQLNYYNSKYNYEFWKKINMPDIFKLEFDGKELINVKNMKI